MSLLARKVSAVWWDQPSGFEDDEIAADQLGGKKAKELRTHDNTLSFWRSDDSRLDGQLGEAALAIAATFAEPDAFEIAWLPREDLVSAGIALAPTEGDTPITALRSRHEDAEKLDMRRLSEVAAVLAVNIRRHGHLHEFTKGEMLSLLARAVIAGQLNIPNLKQKLQQPVQDKIQELRDGE
jgi:hypothetical protein